MGSVGIAGTTTAGALVLSARLDLQGSAMDLGISGKPDGDSMNGTVKFGDFGEFPFTGKRVAATVEAPAAPVANAPAGPPPTDANGKWNIVLTLGSTGSLPLAATLTQDGEKVSGMLSSIAGQVPVSGTMVGKSLKLQFKVATPQGELPITMTGELGAAGFSGKASVAGLAETAWTATPVR